MDTARETELHALIARARLGASPEEVIPAPEMPDARCATPAALVQWLNEWREADRIAINLPDLVLYFALAPRLNSCLGAALATRIMEGSKVILPLVIVSRLVASRSHRA